MYACHDSDDIKSDRRILEPLKSKHHESVPVKNRDLYTYTSIIN